MQANSNNLATQNIHTKSVVVVEKRKDKNKTKNRFYGLFTKMTTTAIHIKILIIAQSINM